MASRVWLYAVIVPVVLFEASVAALALKPDVSDRFRAFFIDKSSDCWRLDITGAYTLGETIVMLPPRSGKQNDILRCGWLGPQDTGAWSSGPESALRFKVDGPPAALVLDLEIIPFVTDVQPVQTVRIDVNGKGLDTIQLEGGDSRHVLIPIPADYVALGDQRVDVDFRFPSAQSPASAKINNDHRLLAIRVMSLTLTKAGTTTK